MYFKSMILQFSFLISLSFITIPYLAVVVDLKYFATLFFHFQVLKIFLNNAFPVPLLKVGAAIRCLDLNSTRHRLAIVDENSDLLVYTLPDGALQYRVRGFETGCSN